MLQRAMPVLLLALLAAFVPAARADVAPPGPEVPGCGGRDVGDNCNTLWFSNCGCLSQVDPSCPTPGTACVVCADRTAGTICTPPPDDDDGGCAVPGALAGSGLAGLALIVGVAALLVHRRRR